MRKKPNKKKETRVFAGSLAIPPDREGLSYPAEWLYMPDGKTPTLGPKYLERLLKAVRLCNEIKDVPKWKHEAAAVIATMTLLLAKVTG